MDNNCYIHDLAQKTAQMWSKFREKSNSVIK